MATGSRTNDTPRAPLQPKASSAQASRAARGASRLSTTRRRRPCRALRCHDWARPEEADDDDDDDDVLGAEFEAEEPVPPPSARAKALSMWAHAASQSSTSPAFTGDVSLHPAGAASGVKKMDRPVVGRGRLRPDALAEPPGAAADAHTACDIKWMLCNEECGGIRSAFRLSDERAERAQQALLMAHRRLVIERHRIPSEPNPNTMGTEVANDDGSVGSPSCGCTIAQQCRPDNSVGRRCLALWPSQPTRGQLQSALTHA